MKYLKILRLSSIAIILFLLAMMVPAAPAQAARGITLSPAEGSIDARITITGTEFNKSTSDTDKYAAIYFSSDEADTSDDIDDEVTVKDYSGYNNDGSAFGVSWVPNGKRGGAYYFDGDSAYISLASPDVFSDIPNNDLTVSIWVKSDDISQDHRLILQGGQSDKDFIILFQTGCEIHFGVSEEGTKHAVRTETLESNKWYHIVGVWDADEKSLLIYANGVPSDEVGYRNYAMGIKDGLEFGHGTTSSRFWMGYMDEFKIYDRTLSANQIYQDYMSSSVGIINNAIIVAQETRISEEWKCIIIPNNAFVIVLSVIVFPEEPDMLILIVVDESIFPEIVL